MTRFKNHGYGLVTHFRIAGEISGPSLPTPLSQGVDSYRARRRSWQLRSTTPDLAAEPGYHSTSHGEPSPSTHPSGRLRKLVIFPSSSAVIASSSAGAGRHGLRVYLAHDSQLDRSWP